MRAVLTIVGLELRRFLRDRSNIFFVFIFPLLLVLMIGAQFGAGSSAGQVSVAGPDSRLRSDLVASLESSDMDVTVADREASLEQVARGRSDVGVFVDRAAATSYAAGGDVELEVVPGSSATAQVAGQQVRGAVDALRVQQGQLAALTGRGIDAATAEAALGDARSEVSGVQLRVESLNQMDQQFAGMGRFDYGASGQLLLFVFLISLAGASTLIEARRLGVVARTMAAPVSTGHVLAGEMLGRFAIAAFQGVYIMAATAVLFDVDWGNLGLSLLVLVVFSIVSAGAAMLLGSLMDNEGAAVGVGVGAGLVLAALGGCMMPLELFPDTMRAIANVTPHAWAYQAFAEIQRRDPGLLDVLPYLAVLAAMAVALLALGTWALRRSQARAM